jgi:hypothetical protein
VRRATPQAVALSQPRGTPLRRPKPRPAPTKADRETKHARATTVSAPPPPYRRRAPTFTVRDVPDTCAPPSCGSPTARTDIAAFRARSVIE